MGEKVEISGRCEPRFEGVREVFEASFAKGEVGAGVCVLIDGELVLELWGGHADKERSRPWERDTIVNTYSTTKGMTAVCANRLIEQGRIDLDAPVAEYWPDFAQKGKQDIPVRYLLCHTAGLPAVSKELAPAERLDWNAMTTALARRRPVPP